MEKSNHPIDFVSKGVPKCLVYASLTILLIIYFLKWGLGTIRAVECLRDGVPGRGRLIDAVALSDFLVFGILAIGIVLIVAIGASVPRSAFPNRDAVGPSLLTAAIWVISLTSIRIIEATLHEVFPGHLDSPCKPPETQGGAISLSRMMSGPSEEAWFAAACAVLVVLTRADLKRRFWIALIFGGVLRTIFHVYQGWASLGYFIWGGLVAVAIAFTGRWVLLAIMHLVHNIVVNSGIMESLDICIIMFIIVLLAICILSWKRGANSFVELSEELYPRRPLGRNLK